jgi:hypothetical protein
VVAFGATAGCGSTSRKGAGPEAGAESGAAGNLNSSSGTDGNTSAGQAGSTGGASGGTIMLPEPTMESTPQCFQPPEPGDCDQQEPRFYYDTAQKRCQEFTYSGCGGNDNRFTSHDECINFCTGVRKCSCAQNQPDCEVAGACSECPVDLAIADGTACVTPGLNCTTPGAFCGCEAGQGASPSWRCRILVGP